MKIIKNCKSAAGTLGLAVGLCFCVAPAAQATVLSNFLTFDGPSGLSTPVQQAGGEDKLQDDSLSTFNDANGNGKLDAGDTVFGVLTLSEIKASGRSSVAIGPTGQVAIVYAALVTAGDSTVPGSLFTFGAAAPGFLSTICGAVCAPAGILGSTIAVVLSTTQTDTIASHDPLNWDATGANGFTANFNGANGNGPWSWEATAGLSSTGANSSFFDGRSALPAGDAATEKGAFQITSQAFAVNWLPVDVTDQNTGARHTNDLTEDFATINFASTAEVARGWAFRDQASFFVNPVAIPEPDVLALMGIALAGIGVTRRRRNQ